MNRDKKNKLISSEFMKAKTKTKIITLTLVTCLLLVLVSFGYFYAGFNQSDRDRLTGGCFNTSFTDQNSINLTNALPESFDDAKQGTPYEFTLTNSCTLPVKYYVLLNVKSGSFDPSFIDFSMNESNYDNLSNVLENTSRFSIDEGYNKSYIIGSGLINSGSETKQLRLWIDEAVNTSDFESNTGFTAQVKVVGEVASQIGTDKIMNLAAGSPTNSTDVIDKGTIGEGTSACTNTLAYDGTIDNNLRYVGANPCNYVSFNNEVWRIIGVMNNIDDGTGKTETRLKIIRKKSLGKYAWNTSSPELLSGFGPNDWSISVLKEELNGDYLNSNLSNNVNWYSGVTNTLNKTFNYQNVLKKNAKSLIADTKWNIGGWDNSDITSSLIYQKERGNNVFSNHSTTWIGKIALIYPSDYGLAVGGENRSACMSDIIDNYNNTNCKSNDYLHLSNSSTSWTLTPRSSHEHGMYYINSEGNARASSFVYNIGEVHPTLYLKSNVSITGGDGSSLNPYTLA